MTSLQVLGAARTVTGSKHLLEVDGRRLLVDCGLYQGLKELRLRNWDTLPVEPSSIEWVVLTHAHLDHTGYLPRLFRGGFRGKIFANPRHRGSPRDPAARLGSAAGRGGRAPQHGTSKHRPALPPYTEAEGRAAAGRVAAVHYGERVRLSPDLAVSFAAPATSRVRAAPQPPGRCSSCAASPGPHKRARGARDPGTGLVGRRASAQRSFHACVSAQTSDGRPVLHR